MNRRPFGSTNNQYIKDINEMLKKDYSENHITSYPKNGKTVYVAVRYERKEYESTCLEDLKNMITGVINEESKSE